MRAQIPGRHDDAGEVMQAASAFTIVQAAFNWLVDNYPGLADWTASARRVALLQISLDELERAEIGRVGRINRCEGKGAVLRLRNLSVTLDDRTLVTGAEVAIMPGEKVLVTGESGSGKSTLVRALAGLWPWGGGDIEMPAGATPVTKRSARPGTVIKRLRALVLGSVPSTAPPVL